MEHPVRQGVVLAAGRGTRLRPLTENLPKPLQPVCNKPIMQYQLEAMQSAGIGEVLIVIGPNGEPIRRHFGDGSGLGLCLRYVEDPEPAGIAASLARTEPYLDGPFAVFLGDIFLSLNDLTPALTPLGSGAAGTIVVLRDTPDAVRRNFAVLVDPDDRVQRVIEKPEEPSTDLKGCGVYVFDGAIFDAIRRTPRSALRNEYEITDAVQILVEMGRPVYASEIVRWDMNVTFPIDLLTCNLRLLREQQRVHLVGRAASVSREATLHHSIVGDGAVVDGPVLLDECLVLPGARIADLFGRVHRSIFGDGVVWSATTG